MSTGLIDPMADSEAEVRRQLREITEPHTKSAQAHGKPDSNRHNDGEVLHKFFNIPPLHKYFARAERHGNALAQHPRAFVDNVVITSDRDLEFLRQLANSDDHEVSYDFRDPHVSHEALERYPPLRAKVMEWIADDPKRANALSAEDGTDLNVHGEPGGGKTTFALSNDLWRMQVNNSTVLHAELVDESGTNERTEWLAFAKIATIAVPSGLDAVARIVPKDVTVPSFEVPLEEIARDVIRYESIQDLMGQLMPGQFYVVFPDPLFRGCEAVSPFTYHTFEEVTPPGEDGPDHPTEADQWWFAFVAHRISGDIYPHPTFVNFDEAGNIFDPDASKATNHYQKIKWFSEKYADARKKGLSVGYQIHSLSDLHTKVRKKIRWRVTMNGNDPPITGGLPKGRSCPMRKNLTQYYSPGEAQIWTNQKFAKITWPNLKAGARLDAEVSIDFKRWQEATGTA